jgi:peptidoglycan/xylan/chitin deacetylase (PgdA/CDA1 family)
MKNLIKIIFSIAVIATVFSAAAFVFLPLPGTIPVLLYHFVSTPEHAAEHKNIVSRQSFERQMEFLRLLRYRVITLEEYYQIKMGKKRPRGREIVITFDDANESFALAAFPILQQRGFPSAVFAVSENIQKRLSGSMTEEMIKKLLPSGLVTLGSHTRTHPSLSKLTDAEIREELVGSKKELERMFHIPIYYLAYPSGDIDERVIRIAEEAGYRLAFTTSYKKLQGLEEGLYTLPRVKITRTSDNPLAFWVHVSGIYQTFKQWRYRIKSS